LADLKGRISWCGRMEKSFVAMKGAGNSRSKMPGSWEESVVEGRTFLAAVAARASALAIKSAEADQLPLGNLPNWRYPDPRVDVLDKTFEYKVGNAAIERITTGSAGPKAQSISAIAAICRGAKFPTTGSCEDDGHASAYGQPSNYTNGNTGALLPQGCAIRNAIRKLSQASRQQ
jgi:hypothetical protein